MDERLERILTQLAAQHAPQVLPMWDRRGDYAQRLPRLARLLANYNLLVIMADFPQSLRAADQDPGALIQAWADAYGQLYTLLARALFPSFTRVSARYADSRWPVIVSIYGEAAPVIGVLAGYVAPFVVYRQPESTVSEVELIGLMEVILEELEASNLPRDASKRLVAEGASILKRLLLMPVRQLPVTEFDRTIFTDSQRLIPVKDAPGTPPLLPEEDSDLLNQPTAFDIQALTPDRAAYTSRADTETLNRTQTIPPGAPPPEAARGLLFPRFRRGKRRPPVPRLPGDQD